MDPNETLRKLREEIRLSRVPGNWSPEVNLAEAAELFEALDEWLSKAGFLPNVWHRDEFLRNFDFDQEVG